MNQLCTTKNTLFSVYVPTSNEPTQTHINLTRDNTRFNVDIQSVVSCLFDCFYLILFSKLKANQVEFTRHETFPSPRVPCFAMAQRTSEHICCPSGMCGCVLEVRSWRLSVKWSTSPSFSTVHCVLVGWTGGSHLPTMSSGKSALSSSLTLVMKSSGRISTAISSHLFNSSTLLNVVNEWPVSMSVTW